MKKTISFLAALFSIFSLQAMQQDTEDSSQASKLGTSDEGCVYKDEHMIVFQCQAGPRPIKQKIKAARCIGDDYRDLDILLTLKISAIEKNWLPLIESNRTNPSTIERSCFEEFQTFISNQEIKGGLFTRLVYENVINEIFSKINQQNNIWEKENQLPATYELLEHYVTIALDCFKQKKEKFQDAVHLE